MLSIHLTQAMLRSIRVGCSPVGRWLGGGVVGLVMVGAGGAIAQELPELDTAGALDSALEQQLQALEEQPLDPLPDSLLEAGPQGADPIAGPSRPTPPNRLNVPTLNPTFNPDDRSLPLDWPLESSSPLLFEDRPIEESIEDKFRRYRLGPGDFLLITVQRFPDLTFQGTVNPEGAIVFPLLGIVPLAGFSLQEAQGEIQRRLDQYIINPQVSLSLLAQRPVQVTVVGAIARPGFYTVTSTRISDALIGAGGTLPEADLRAVQVYRTLPDTSVITQTLDLYTPLLVGQPLPSLRLEDGDVVKVWTQVEAEEAGLLVARSGTDGVADGADGADGAEVQAYRDRLVSRSTLAANLPLKIRILSYAAGAGGTLSLPAGSTFRDALNGIPLDSANLRRIALIRYDEGSGEVVRTMLDGRQALMGDPTVDVPLQDNDVIVVGRSLISRVSFMLNQFTQPFRDILGFLLFFDSISDSASNLFQPSGN